MIRFSEQAKKTIDLILNTEQNVFVTGKAGTGKSTLLDHIRSIADRRIVILAPTGISAVNIDGETIHSFFTLKPGFEKEEAMHMVLDKGKQKKFKRIKTLAIDEISMVRADLLDAVDIVLRRSRKINKPFGGVQMVFFGDLYQLPPVVTSNDREKFFSEYKSPYFFDAEVFKEENDGLTENFKMIHIELEKIYRQSNLQFITLLNAIRDNSITCEQIDELNKRCEPNFTPTDSEKYIYLMTTNKAASGINEKKLRQLPGEETVFTAEKTGKVTTSLYPNDEKLVFRVGAQIMFISNDSERRWVNGTIGKILKISNYFDEESGLKETKIKIEKSNGDVVEVKKHLWEISKYVFEDGDFKRKTLGSFEQMPIKLAWAITIHKGQGKTFEKVIIDLSTGSFAHGQTYVALSRCSSFEGLVLKRPLRKSDIIMDKRVHDFACKKA